MLQIVVRSLAAITILSLFGCNPPGGGDYQQPNEDDPAIRSAVESISEADVRRRVNLIADDAMGGRDTPSPGLDQTAAYISSEFQRMGLEPLMAAGEWYQRYGIRLSVVDPAASSMTVSLDTQSARLELATGDFSLSRGAPAEAVIKLPLVIAGGGAAPSSRAERNQFQGKVLLWAASGFEEAPPGAERRISRDERRRALSFGETGGAAGVVIAVPPGVQVGTTGPSTTLVSTEFSGPFQVTAREDRLTSELPALATALEQARTSPEVITLTNPSWSVAFETAFEQNDSQLVPNVVGVVRGGDPELRDQYVVISAHFDHVGSRCARDDETDRICNGADDNASGTTGLLELAEAFSQTGARPRRSVIFVAVSGEERGLLGSRYFAENPPVPIDQIVSGINMDHLGRNWTDAIVVIGTEHSSLGTIPEAVTESHPELNVKPLPDQWPDQRIYFRSDHFNFAKEGVPILFFTNGFHEDYHRVTDSPDKIDAEKESRVVRYIYYIAFRVANGDERPQWNPDSYREIVRPERQRPGAAGD